jgi:arsenate reductase
MSNKKTTILFLCTGNSARSIMAEAIANSRFGKHLDAVSAGAEPKDAPHPLTLETLTRHDVPTDGLTSKSWQKFAESTFDLVITVCDSAKDKCPTFPGEPTVVHWHLPDPPAAENPVDMFEGVFETLDEAVGILAHGPDPEPAGRAREAARHVSRRFSPRAV